MASSSPRSKRWILPLVVVLLWLFVGGPLGSFAGRLAEVQENDNASFLPQTAESTKVLNTFLEFTGAESTPATAVFERPGGLTEADRATIASYADELGQVEYVDTAAVGAPIYSEDGTAAQVVVPDHRLRRRPDRRGGQRHARRAGRPAGRAHRPGRRAGRHPRRLHRGVRRHRRHPAAGRTGGGAADPARRLPLAGAAVRGADLGGDRARGVLGGHLRDGQQRRPRPQRPEPGHPVHPRGGGGHGLLAADRGPVPRGAA